VGVDRLRRAVGTFRNLIVARWACNVVENVARDGIEPPTPPFHGWHRVSIKAVRSHNKPADRAGELQQ
jgi:hypothetical protein